MFGPEYWGLTVVDWLCVVAYFAGMVVVGKYVAARQKTTGHYFTASGKIPGWAAGLSLYATLLSSFTFIGFPGQTYDYDWQVLVQQFSTPLVVLFVAFFAIPIFRRVVRVSAYEYLERRYGYVARAYGTAGFITDHFFKMAVVISTMALALAGITGISQDAIIIAVGVVTILYTFMGGIEGVIWADVAQGILMLASSLLALGYLFFFASPEGPAALIAASDLPVKMKLIDPAFTMTGKTFWVILWSGLFHFTTRYLADQTMVQRYLTAPTLREARKSVFISIAACFVLWLVFPLIGTLLHGFYTLHPERLAASVDKGDKVFPFFVGNELPAGLVGILLVGLVAASMSTIASELNSLCACMVSDFYGRLRPHADDRRKLWLSRFLVLVLGVAAIVLALWIARHKAGVMTIMLNFFNWIGATFGGGMLAMFLIGFFLPRVTRRAMYPALVSGFAFAFWCAGTSKGWFTLPDALAFLKYRWHEWWLIGLSPCVIAAVAVLLSVALPPGKPAPIELTAYAPEE